MPKGVDKETGRSHRLKDRSGTRNGRLVFTKMLGTNKHKQIVWGAVCDCGSVISTANPREIKSCGCLRREVAAENAASRRFLTDEERAVRLEANRKRQRERRKTNPVTAMQSRLSRLHRHALSQVNAIKSSPTFEELGYSVFEFVLHIEKQFEGGMGWDNMNDWQIDHIIPSSTARNKEDVISLNQLSNLRPMWAKDNNFKKDKREFLI